MLPLKGAVLSCMGAFRGTICGRGAAVYGGKCMPRMEAVRWLVAQLLLFMDAVLLWMAAAVLACVACLRLRSCDARYGTGVYAVLL